jgi:hypothetical protein
MNDAKHSIDDLDLMNDEGAVATLEADEDTQAVARPTGPCCEKCGVEFNSQVVTICRACGWYSSLNTYVELDQKWEATTNGEPVVAVAQKLGPADWLKLIPRWGWFVIACASFIVVESVAVRLSTPGGSSLRTAWSLTQLTLGAMTFIGCHIFNFLMLAAEDTDVGILDMLLKPLRLWGKTCRWLPKRLWLFNSLVCGCVAVLMSFLVIGGLPYERLWDWGFTEPPKQNLMAAVMDQAKKVEGEDKDLEEAVQDFAGKGEVDPDEAAQKAKQAAEKKREHTDCVIIGYQAAKDGHLEWLVLATAHRHNLAYAGKVKPKLSDEELAQMVDVLKSNVVKEPFISVQMDNVTWVKVKYACRVSFTEQFSDGRLRDAEWDKMLGAMKGADPPPAPEKSNAKGSRRKR